MLLVSSVSVSLFSGNSLLSDPSDPTQNLFNKQAVFEFSLQYSVFEFHKTDLMQISSIVPNYTPIKSAPHM